MAASLAKQVMQSNETYGPIIFFCVINKTWALMVFISPNKLAGKYRLGLFQCSLNKYKVFNC